ncbi:MAG: hypothetical protein CO064_11060 [Anaerolineae bacterium CG_4_9_14_0_8_um_filter_58_9]|nr:MAG: hypothetical protein CO064_11060 [Anaerolineae bacterium CG_4_9_14_0_8_um_filter_58_9]
MSKLLLSAIVALGIIASLVILIFKRIWSKEAENRKAIEKTNMDDPGSVTATFDKLNRCLIIGILLFFSGCARTILHPIEGSDIVRVKQGQSFEAPKDGYFLSNEYIKLVMEATVE